MPNDNNGDLTSRARVALAIAHQTIDRIPIGHIGVFHGDTIPRLEAYLGVQGEDEVREQLGLDDRAIRVSSMAEEVDGLGERRSLWSGAKTQRGFAAPTSAAAGPRPLREANTVAEVEAHSWPDPDDWVMEPLSPERKVYLNSFSVLSPNIPPIFITLSEMMGMDVALMNLLLAPAVVEAAIARIAEISLEVQRRALDTYGDTIHQVRIWDDVADQRNLIFQPELWRKFFLPQLAKAFDLAKSYGLIVHYHCCGAMSEIIPDLIDIGMDVLEPCQVHLPGMEPERLKREYGRHITFWGGVNTQRTLPFGIPNEVRQEVRERVRVLGRGGGYVLSPDHSLLQDVPPENIVALYEEARHCTP